MIVALSALAGVASAAEAEKSPAPPVPKLKKNNLAPLATNETIVTAHSPFEAGDCSICHKNKDPQNPGPISTTVNDQCLGCHEDFAQVMARKFSHGAASASCVNCHNPHNAKQPKLLVEELGSLCLSCHQETKKLVTQSKVTHGAIDTASKCLNCHDPHAANVEHVLTHLPFDLCINCHGKDGVKDHTGKDLANFKKLLAENKEHHGPVASKDCSACHKPHGSDFFRLLGLEYPPQFYSPYDRKLYALCWECHESSLVEAAETTTLTNFRDGNRNLHYVHVDKADRGRTCRACHEVHASKQPHQIRDEVPYGTKGYMLKINYAPTPTGGTCTKTCHPTKSYNNTAVANPAPSK
jgi:predicted CXXCH cytochrome family protein